MTSFHEELQRYRPALALDRLMSVRVRKNVSLVLLLLILGCILGAGFFLFQDAPRKEVFLTIPIPKASAVFLGVALLFLISYIKLKLFEYYYRTLLYRGIETAHPEDDAHVEGMTYEAARAVAQTPDDVVSSLFHSSRGEELLLRLGVNLDVFAQHLESARAPLPAAGIPFPEGRALGFGDVAQYAYEHDTGFAQFLFSCGIQKELYDGAVSWISRTIEEELLTSRWWSRDNLGRIHGLGKEFSYGIAYELEKYIRPLGASTVFSTMTEDSAYLSEKVVQIETALARAHEANVFLVGESGAGTMDALLSVARHVRSGKSVASVTGKHFTVFDWNAFVADHNTKQTFEAAFMKTFAQAARAGNIAIIIEDFPKFMASVAAIGADVSETLDRYLTSAELQIIATSEPRAYHAEVETNAKLLGHFTVIHVESPDLSGVVRILTNVAPAEERMHSIYFTYPALVSIAEGADRYLVEGVMPDKAVDLLSEIAPVAKEKGATLVTREFVESYIGGKTGIPAGSVKEGERDTLLNLESVLHARVIGQDDAIKAIADAMRRARAGVQAKDRPMGSFLFLGSTGVGKTETAKALAAIFFGDEAKMSRVDMSEYSGPDALSRLMGDTHTPGALSSMLREHPYGVLLLDEFEKAARDVHNLFLQILDEGMFTDGRGEKINARNAIIIATSNAGSQLIWDMASRGEDPSLKKDTIIDTIVKDGLYAPELINRFDGVIIFKPLSREDQKKIATLMLEELRGRVKEKGYELVVNDTLVNLLLARGYDPKFGARPMRRVIQDVVEERIAKKIIDGSLALGGSITFTNADFPPTGA